MTHESMTHVLHWTTDPRLKPVIHESLRVKDLLLYIHSIGIFGAERQVPVRKPKLYNSEYGLYLDMRPCRDRVVVTAPNEAVHYLVIDK